MSSQFSKFRSIVILPLFSIALLSSSLHGCCPRAETVAGCTFEGMVGSYPIRLRCFFNIIKKTNDALQADRPLPRLFNNRLLLYGPTGNGKTTLAHKIALESGSTLFSLPGPSIVQRYVGQGAQNVRDHFEDACIHVERNRNTAIIFIDEIDALANTTREGRQEHLAAVEQLWMELGKIEEDPRIAFIGATDNFNRINNSFLKIFGSNKIEIKNPDEKTRREVLIHYKRLRTNEDWDQRLLNYIVSKTKDFNIRNLKDLVEDVCMIAEISNNNIITEKIIQEVIPEIEQKAKEEQESQGSEVLGQIAVLSASIVLAGIVVKFLSVAAKTYFGAPMPEPPQTQRESERRIRFTN